MFRRRETNTTHKRSTWPKRELCTSGCVTLDQSAEELVAVLLLTQGSNEWLARCLSCALMESACLAL